ncbi:MAG: LacI family DNA-binding transcriptional regulator [Planctomycetes bacterium]|jgi:LacI family transcriptional regulator|nr:LacI family DNA-binding transcriptional regulator [Planctomycetota bacterium]
MALPPSLSAARTILATIAAEVGVSTRTVYRVLNEREGEVWSSASKRGERIRALAHTLGYKPNLAARSTRTGRFGQVGFVMGMGDSASSFSHVFLKGLHDGLSTAEIALVATRMSDELLASSDRLPAILASLSVDGLMLLHHKPETAAMRRALNRCGLPLVWLNDRRAHDSVCYDDHQAAVDAITRLHALRHRRIAYLGGGSADHYSSREREAGYRAAMAASGLADNVVELAETAGQSLHERVEAWLRAAVARSAKTRPTAVLCYSGEQALAIQLAAGRLGIAVPEQLSIVYCAQDEARPAGLTLSRMYCESHRLGMASAEMMVRKLAQPRRRQPSVALPYAWWELGTSVAPPSAPA